MSNETFIPQPRERAESSPKDARQAWERPLLRRLAANEAENVGGNHTHDNPTHFQS
jgi:hypothetical protein